MDGESFTQGEPLPVLESEVVRFVCISDTHNDDCRDAIPDGDILLHAGDLTDFGDLEELQRAVDWLMALPHRLKVVIAGNHDMSLDPTHSRYDPRAREMLTSPAARAAGIRYLDCVPHGSVYTVARYRVRAVRSDAGGATAHEADGATGDGLGGSLRSLRIYANPRQPEFLGKPYAFIYPPAPSAGADAAWELAPGWRDHDGVQIWLCHSPPMGRLDRVPVPGLTGCAVMAAKVAEARPLLCVFGHYHYSWGVERVVWGGEGGTEAVVGPPMAANVTCLAMSKERQEAEKIEAPMKTAFDFTGNGEEKRLEVGKETVFVNAGWMTMKKSQWEYRNPPFVVTLALP